MKRVQTFLLSILLLTSLAICACTHPASSIHQISPPAPVNPPALFLVGDSTMNTGAGSGTTGPWGWGQEIIPMFDPQKIHVYNEGRGGRSSRSYIEEGLWKKTLDQLHPGDFVILQFGHNDAANSANYPDRTTLPGSGDDTQDIESPATHQKETLHTYGWYLRQYIKDINAKHATPILCSPVPRNTWTNGKIKRGFDGYAQWAADTAKSTHTLFIDLNALSADRFDALGQPAAAKLFNDNQHTTKPGARLNAESVIAGLQKLNPNPLQPYLLPTPANPAATTRGAPR